MVPGTCFIVRIWYYSCIPQIFSYFYYLLVYQPCNKKEVVYFYDIPVDQLLILASIKASEGKIFVIIYWMGHKSKKKSHKSSKSKELDTKFGRYLDCHLADALTKALLTSPKLLDEFPQIVNALDKGEYINIDGISNIPARECLIEVFNNISIVRNDSQGHGWYRHAKNEKIASHILRVLGDAKVIKDPKKLESSEIQSSRIAPLQLLSMIQSFPNFVTEVPIIIDQILEGHAVQLDEISDDELSIVFRKLFITLGLVHTDDGLDVPTGKREGDQVIDCLEHFEEIFKSYKRGLCGNHIQNKSDGYKSSSSTESVKSASSHSQLASNERDEEILRGDESGLEIGPSKKVVGPSVPSRIELEKARLLMANYDKDDESSDNEDGYGPQTCIRESGSVENNPIGYSGIDVFKPLREVEQVNSVSNVHTREEWLLSPGESKSITG